SFPTRRSSDLVTEETRERLREQANQLPEATVLRLCDLLAVAIEDMRQGGDPRLPLELALVKGTRPAAHLSRESVGYRLAQLEAPPPPRAPPRAADLSRESVGYRLEQLEARPSADSGTVSSPPSPKATSEPNPESAPSPPGRALEQLREAWERG